MRFSETGMPPSPDDHCFSFRGTHEQYTIVNSSGDPREALQGAGSGQDHAATSAGHGRHVAPGGNSSRQDDESLFLRRFGEVPVEGHKLDAGSAFLKRHQRRGEMQGVGGPQGVGFQ
jgi:hypothetical protein